MFTIFFLMISYGRLSPTAWVSSSIPWHITDSSSDHGLQNRLAESPHAHDSAALSIDGDASEYRFCIWSIDSADDFKMFFTRLSLSSQAVAVEKPYHQISVRSFGFSPQCFRQPSSLLWPFCLLHSFLLQLLHKALLAALRRVVRLQTLFNTKDVSRILLLDPMPALPGN